MFRMVETYGIPLDIVVLFLDQRGIVPDWLHFYEMGVKSGWKPEGIVSKLDEAIVDVYGPDWRDQWKRRFDAIIKVE